MIRLPLPRAVTTGESRCEFTLDFYEFLPSTCPFSHTYPTTLDTH